VVYVVIGAIVVALVAFFVIKSRRSKESFFPKPVRGSLECDEGQFSVSGNEGKYVIRKDNRFEFTVDEGQIVSVKDKAVSNEKKAY